VRRRCPRQTACTLTSHTAWVVFCCIGFFSLFLGFGTWVAAETRVVTADQSLGAWAVHEWLLGANYRDLWTTSIEVEVLDLKTVAGGLRPLFRVGGRQTFGLAIAGADGRSYTFRSLAKDLGQALPEDFRDYLIGDLVQDQLAAILPGAPIVVPPLAEAAGVLHNVPRLVVMPDDPALGKFRQAFAGLLGTFEEFPTPASDDHPGFHGATEILSTKKFWPRLLASPSTRVDAQAFLRARLFDFFLGDWDRHAAQWRWMKLPGKTGWQPFPEDRDTTFSTYEGALLELYRPFRPTLMKFRDTYGSRTGLTSQGWKIHRWLLPELEKSAWIEMAADLQSRLTDAVIDQAVRRLPAPYYALQGAEMASTLKARRDRLPEFAESLYRFLAAEVEVQGTNAGERVELRALGQGGVEVRVSLMTDGVAHSPYFRRSFHAAETQSLRIYLRQGDDTLGCRGRIGDAIKIEVIGHAEDDMIKGCETARLRFTQIEELERRYQPVRQKPKLPLESPSSSTAPPLWERPRDWRYRIVPVYWVTYGSDLGLLAGGGLTIDRFEFGKTPFGQRHSLKAGYAFGLETFEVGYQGAYQHWEPRLLSTLEAKLSGLEQVKFFGLGNETSDDGPDDFFETKQFQYRLTPALRYVVSSWLDLFAGGRLTYASIDDDDDTLLNRVRPYGVGEFGQIGFFIGLDVDTRDRTRRYGPGLKLRFQSTLFPDIWDIESVFGAVEGEIAVYLTLSPRLLLAGRVHGKNVFGTFPFHEAAYIGGNDSLRGYDKNRFGGDAAVFANTELRFILGQASALLFRAEWGLFIFGDVGRVFLDGEDSNRWRPSGGGGISISTDERSLLWSLTVARSEEQTTFFLKANFSF